MFAKYTKESTANATLKDPPSHTQHGIDIPGTFNVRKCYKKIANINNY